MHADQNFQRYLDELTVDSATACSDFNNTNRLWTLRSTRALVATGLAAYPGRHPTAKGHLDKYLQSEYLCLDICICSADSWQPPHMIAEHENSRSRERVQFDAWKLLIVEAERRVLVAYYGDESRELADFSALSSAVAEVCLENRGKDILVIGAERKKARTISDLRALHTSRIVGVHH